MGIIDLRNAVKEKININYIDYEEKDKYYLSELSPANAHDNVINILKSLPEETKIEAEAHELAHILLREKGRICLSSNYNEMDFFTLELNNAISHKDIIDMLENQFYISSELHLKLRHNSISNIERYNDDVKYFVERNEIYILYGLGFRLYDIYITSLNSQQDKIEIMAELNSFVKESFDTSKKYLKNISSNVSKEGQKEVIISILNELNIPMYKINIE